MARRMRPVGFGADVLATVRGGDLEQRVGYAVQTLSALPQKVAGTEVAGRLAASLQEVEHYRNECLNRVAILALSSTLPGECDLG